MNDQAADHQNEQYFGESPTITEIAKTPHFHSVSCCPLLRATKGGEGSLDKFSSRGIIFYLNGRNFIHCCASQGSIRLALWAMEELQDINEALHAIDIDAKDPVSLAASKLSQLACAYIEDEQLVHAEVLDRNHTAWPKPGKPRNTLAQRKWKEPYYDYVERLFFFLSIFQQLGLAQVALGSRLVYHFEFGCLDQKVAYGYQKIARNNLLEDHARSKNIMRYNFFQNGDRMESLDEYLTDKCLLCGVFAYKLSGLITLSNISHFVMGNKKVSRVVEHLDLNSAGLSGSWRILFRDLRKLSTLTYLDLSENNISGDLLNQHVKILLHLRGLNVARNHAFGMIPTFDGLQHLYLANLSNNLFTGIIPATLSSISSLRELWMSHNNLQGPLTHTISRLINLEALALADNNLTGTIPNGISKLQRLRILYLQENRFEGQFPASLLRLGSSLVTLSLRSNLLTGKIPSEIDQLSALKRLHLGSNKLEGRIPKEIGNMVSLCHLYLNNNCLTGHIPAYELVYPYFIATIDLRANAGLESKARASKRMSLTMRNRKKGKRTRVNVRVLTINPTAEYNEDAENWRV